VLVIGCLIIGAGAFEWARRRFMGEWGAIEEKIEETLKREASA
jgi:hypothetical protein